ncbi:DoxX family protein [Flagellimonas flava]|uniref:Putative oxidoreductase n=1 Tax=Flagellimonas flava TaxID=570519 RepID=A0A1M5JZV5_9FLAO|nr:DoxX family protein [Allomuricauda flava]SHG45553.1 putative oxidoreductase [Allomuricauda flava]
MKNRFSQILSTHSDWSFAIIRWTLGVVIFAHGAQKLLGIWGGHGMSWTVEAWEQWWNVPSLFTYIVIFIESIGALLLFIGFLSRLWAFFIGIIMVVAVLLVHFRWGFFMNWYMQPQSGEGFEYHLLVLAMVLVIVMKGGGKFSLDYYITNRKN